MDEVLLRRLVGASVLLAIAFGVASLLPDPGPAHSGAVAAYDLRTGLPIGTMPLPRAEAPPQPLPDADTDGDETPPPKDPARAPAAPAPAAAAASAKAPPAEAKEPDKPQAPAGGWYVQVGSYSSQANARGVLQKLFGLGMPTVINTIQVGKTLWYRVRVGPYDSEAKAQKAFATIKKEGYTTSKLVRPDAGTPPKGN